MRLAQSFFAAANMCIYATVLDSQLQPCNNCVASTQVDIVNPDTHFGNTNNPRDIDTTGADGPSKHDIDSLAAFVVSLLDKQTHTFSANSHNPSIISEAISQGA